jgi:hypothetical protein
MSICVEQQAVNSPSKCNLRPNGRADQFFKIGKGSFNPEPTATVANPEKNTVAVGSGLNERKTDRPWPEWSPNRILSRLQLQ